MNANLIIVWACVAFASASYLPEHTGNLENTFVIETKDGLYALISDEEAERLRLARDVQEQIVEPQSTGRESGSKITFIPREEVFDEPAFLNPDAGEREKRQINVQGGGSRGQGFDVSAQARAKLWESQNKLNSVHGTASYSQHLGGPYGNSRPNYGAGVVFTRKF